MQPLSSRAAVRFVAGTVGLCTVVWACASNAAPTYDIANVERASVAVSSADYYGLAWLPDSRLALVMPGSPGDASIVLVDLDGRAIDRVRPAARGPNCVNRVMRALTTLPTGELGFAAVCQQEVGESPEVAELFAYDPDEGQLRSLGQTAEPPVEMTWSSDMSRAVYTAHGDICATLYATDGSDGPLRTEVTAQGRRIPLGENLADATDGCTSLGNADHPAYSPDDHTLAVVAAAVKGPGQERIDQFWDLILVFEDGSSQTVISSIQHPRGLGWVTNEELVFAGKIAGLEALWMIRRDGTGLTRLSTDVLDWLSVDVVGSRVAGIITDPDWRSKEVDELSNEIVWYDVRDNLRK